MGKVESFLVGTCCFLAGDILKPNIADIYLIALIMLMLCMLTCSKEIIKTLNNNSKKLHKKICKMGKKKTIAKKTIIMKDNSKYIQANSVNITGQKN